MCMGRRLRSNVRQTTKQLTTQCPYLEDFRETNSQFKERQKHYFDKGHRVKDLSPIPNDTDVRIKSEREPMLGTVVAPAQTPRSYMVDTPSGQVERNRRHLNIVPSQEESQTTLSTVTNDAEQANEHATEPEQSQPLKVFMTHSKTGTTLHQPDWYGDRGT